MLEITDDSTALSTACTNAVNNNAIIVAPYYSSTSRVNPYPANYSNVLSVAYTEDTVDAMAYNLKVSEAGRLINATGGGITVAGPAMAAASATAQIAALIGINSTITQTDIMVAAKAYPTSISKAFSTLIPETETPLDPETVVPITPDPYVFPFTDVPTSHWSYDYIYKASYNSIINGVTSTTFRPDRAITRAEFVTILANIENANVANSSYSNPFIDSGSHWGVNAIKWAYNNGIISGTSGTTFEPNATITRQDAVKMIYRYAQYKTLVPPMVL